MPRRREIAKREVPADPIYNSPLVTKFISTIMRGGKRSTAERIMYQAQRFGISPDEYVKRAQQSGQLGAIFADVRRGKALAAVVRQATVTDATGNTLDLDELFGESKSDDSTGESTEQ